jgi:hypothetical protein
VSDGGFGSEAQAGAESLDLGVGDDAALLEFHKLPERLGGIGASPVPTEGRSLRRGPNCRWDGRTNRLLGPAPALTPSKPARINLVGASRDGCGADHLAQEDHGAKLARLHP